MRIGRKFLGPGLVAAGLLLPSVSLVPASAQAPPLDNPCGSRFEPEGLGRTRGLFPAEGGTLVYDANLGVCWLADANLAASPSVRSLLGVTGINPDGTMDYPTALNWVDALNKFDSGKGFLGHNNWQLPATPRDEEGCSSVHDGGNFGVTCTESGLGSLYNVGLRRKYPDSVVTDFVSLVWPFFNLQPGLYWTSTSQDTDDGEGGRSTFSFNTGKKGLNTTTYNFFHVLPMTAVPLGPLPAEKGVQPYTSGPAAFKAVYDSDTGVSWLLDANLAAHRTFGVTGSTTIVSNVNGRTYTVPRIARDGAMLYEFADPTATDGWIAGLNADNYAGSNTWTLPAIDDISTLYSDMLIQGGDLRLESGQSVGPFWRLQPGFYWGCQRDPGTPTQAPCNLSLHPGHAHGPLETPMDWSFNFDDGFEGTDLPDKLFYVMVYFPASSK